MDVCHEVGLANSISETWGGWGYSMVASVIYFFCLYFYFFGLGIMPSYPCFLVGYFLYGIWFFFNSALLTKKRCQKKKKEIEKQALNQ